MDADSAEDFGAGLEGHVRWSELGLVLTLTAFGEHFLEAPAPQGKDKKAAREWAKAKQYRRAGIQCFHSLAPGAPFHLCPPTDVMYDLELWRMCSDPAPLLWAWVVLEFYLQGCWMSKKYFTCLLFLQFWPAPMPSSVFKIALFPKLGIYLLKGFFSMLLQVIVLQGFSAELLFWWKGIEILNGACLAPNEWLGNHHQEFCSMWMPYL